MIRNFVFGVEDSLVSTVGLLAGIAAADITSKTIVTTGLVLIFVEAFSMGIGSFLTEEAAEEMDGGKSYNFDNSIGAVVMFVSYLLAGLFPLAPYVLFPRSIQVEASITTTLVGLVILGYGSSCLFGHKYPWTRAVKMVVMGGLAVAVGMAVGHFFPVVV